MAQKFFSLSDLFLAALKEFTENNPDNRKKIKVETGISAGLLSNLEKERSSVSNDKKRLIASVFGYDGDRYDEFLEIGYKKLIDKDSDISQDQENKILIENKLLSIRLYDKLELSDQGNFIDSRAFRVRDDLKIDCQLIKNSPPGGLIASLARDNSLAPVITFGDFIVIDTKDAVRDEICEGKIYAICSDLSARICDLRYLRWAEKCKSLIINSLTQEEDSIIFRKLSDVKIIGRVIWSSKYFQ
jgi:phage repressor protein C with HTH and peptisase S24 domain